MTDFFEDGIHFGAIFDSFVKSELDFGDLPQSQTASELTPYEAAGAVQSPKLEEK